MAKLVEKFTDKPIPRNYYDTDEEFDEFFEAKKLLDEVKEGIPHPLYKIILALQLTGDLDFE
jgi:hypothetical protein